MSRAVWKVPFLDTVFARLRFKDQKLPQIWSRRSRIFDNFVGRSVRIHGGKRFLRVLIKRYMVGYSIGQFCTTKIVSGAISIHTRKKKKSKSRRSRRSR